MVKKQFDAWISRNFKGLSAYTLYQYLVKFHCFSESYADEIVFVKLFNYFTKKDCSDNNTQLFYGCKEIISTCEWL